jgi:hypothetical protein
MKNDLLVKPFFAKKYHLVKPFLNSLGGDVFKTSQVINFEAVNTFKRDMLILLHSEGKYDENI